MQENEFRVRPVTRYVLTHYNLNDGKGAVRNVGEFPNVESAEEVAVALQALVPGSTLTTIDGRQAEYPPKALAAAMAVRHEAEELEYVIVERSFDPDAKAYYADCVDHAESHRMQLEAHYRREFRVFSRAIRDPMKLTARKMGGIPSYAPLTLKPERPDFIPIGTAVICLGVQLAVSYVKLVPGSVLYGLENSDKEHVVEASESDLRLAKSCSPA